MNCKEEIIITLVFEVSIQSRKIGLKSGRKNAKNSLIESLCLTVEERTERRAIIQIIYVFVIRRKIINKIKLESISSCVN